MSRPLHTEQKRATVVESYKSILIRQREDFISHFEAENIKLAGGEIRNNVQVNKYFDDSKYKGQMSEGRRHGKGIYYYANGDIYGGQWRNNLFHGKGAYIFAGGERYEGNLINGKKHGKGKYFYINGNTYEGEWAFDKKNGQGNYNYAESGGK